jgi:6-phosphogluconolactonase (cycloisomerase 2 family)
MKFAVVLGMLCTSVTLQAGWFCTGAEEKKTALQEETVVTQKPSFVANSATLTPADSVATGESPLFVAYSHSNASAAVVNRTDDTVSIYNVDKCSGEFTERSFSPVATGQGPLALAYSPCDGYLAVCGWRDQSEPGDQSPGNIHIYRIPCKTGEPELLQVITQAEDSTLKQPQSIDYSPCGRFAAVANFGEDAVTDSIVIYRVSHATGKFLLPPTMVIVNPSEGDGATGLSYSPDGKSAAVTFFFSSNVVTYQVDPVDGYFLNPTSHTAGIGSVSVAYSPNGKFAAVANHGNNTVSTYTVDQITGQFTATVPPTATAGSGPQYVGYSKDSKVAAVTNALDGNVTHYCVDQQTGLFTNPVTFPINGATGGAYGLAFAPCSNFVTVTNSTDNLALTFKVDSSTCP